METSSQIQLSSIIHWLDGFFFGAVSNLPLAIFRIVLGLIIAFYTLRGAKDFPLFMGERSLYPNNMYKKISSWGFSVIDLFPNSKLFPIIFPYLVSFAALVFAAGIFTPFTTVITYILWMSLNRRVNILRSSGDSLITILLFYFIFSDSGQSLSIDRWFSDQSFGLDSTVKAWPLRLMQIQVCVIYLHAYNFKIGGAFWRNGTALMNAVAFRPWGKAWVRGIIREPLISKTLNFMTLSFQILIPFFIWPTETRLIAIFCGVVMHIGMVLCLNLAEFGPLMVSAYLLFYDPLSVQTLVSMVGP